MDYVFKGKAQIQKFNKFKFPICLYADFGINHKFKYQQKEKLEWNKIITYKKSFKIKRPVNVTGSMVRFLLIIFILGEKITLIKTKNRNQNRKVYSLLSDYDHEWRTNY